ncbi:hypothetical protein GCM10010308_32210 [Streptomyces vinaceusdrappus]|nr:hypothetical protein GCM10010308_32210 [Streptomyces vinaceusdrappus]
MARKVYAYQSYHSTALPTEAARSCRTGRRVGGESTCMPVMIATIPWPWTRHTSRTEDLHTDATAPFPDVCCSWNTPFARITSSPGTVRPVALPARAKATP